MKDVNYKEINGEVVAIKDFELPRSINILEGIIKHPFCELVEVRKTNSDEIIIAELKIEVPSIRKYDIQESETVAIKCNLQDNDWPLVYALRENFPKGLIHTNLHGDENPVWICYTEENFEEVKRSFTALKFIEQIRKWFELSSTAEIHADDQPLEPFFIPKGVAILPLSDLQKPETITRLSVRNINDKLIHVSRSREDNGDVLCVNLLASPINQGVIQKQPNSLGDLNTIVNFESRSFTEYVSTLFMDLHKKSSDFKHIYNQKLGLICHIPRKRNKEDEKAENIVSHLYISHKTISGIAVELGLWAKNENYYVPLLDSSVEIDDIAKIQIDFWNLIPDFDRLHAAHYNGVGENNGKYSIIGTGALGSQFLNNIARMGFGKWQPVDHDLFLPHNSARHFLTKKHVGHNKAECVASELNFIIGDTQNETFNAIPKNFLSLTEEEIIDRFKDSKAIIDMSTSIAVQRRLTLDLSSEINSRRITAFLNPKGTDSVLFAEDVNRETKLDQLEMEYYRHLVEMDELSNHLSRNNEQIRYASNSCRDISSKISQENIALHTAILTKAIRKNLLIDEGSIKIWQLNEADGSVQNHSFTPSSWTEINHEGWKVKIDNTILKKLFIIREGKLPKETGGVLIGAYDFERKIIYVNNILPAPVDSEENTSTFLRGKEGLQEQIEQIETRTNNETSYIGEWHSHPNDTSLLPSNLDMNFFLSIRKLLSNQGFPTLMLILGDQEFNILISTEDEI